MIKSNISQGDKLVRLTLGISIALIAVFTTIYWMLIISGLLIFTALINYCPLYPIFGIKTKKTHPSPFKAKGKHKK